MPIRMIKPEEFERLNKLLVKSYRAEKDQRFQRLNQAMPLRENGGFVYELSAEEAKALNLSAGEFVSFVGIYTQKLNYYGTPILNGGIRWVCTAPEVRKKGYGLATMKKALDYMESNHDISILFSGAHRFYEKLGWCSNIPNYRYEIDYAELMEYSMDSDDKMRLQFDIGNLDEIKEIQSIQSYFQYDKLFSVLRSVKDWERMFKADPYKMFHYALISFKQNVIGYLSFTLESKKSKLRGKNKVNVVVNEASSRYRENKGISILQGFMEFVQEEMLNSEKDEIEKIVFTIAPVHELIEAGFETDLIKHAKTSIQSGGMVRITNPYTLLEKMRPKLLEQLQTLEKHPFSTLKLWLELDSSGNYPGGLLIEKTETGPWEITIQKTTLSALEMKEAQANFEHVACRSIRGLTNLIVGGFTAKELVERKEMTKPKKDIIKLLDLLFPATNFCFYTNDRF